MHGLKIDPGVGESTLWNEAAKGAQPTNVGTRPSSNY